SELLGVSAFEHKVAGLAEIHLVQQGAELAYLLRHDPEFRRVRQEHLVQAGQRVRLKKDIKHFVEFLERGAEGVRFSFFVVSAAQNIARIAKRTVVSDNALGVLVPILEDVMGWGAVRIRELFESYGLVVQEWDKARTDWVTIREDSTG